MKRGHKHAQRGYQGAPGKPAMTYPTKVAVDEIGPGVICPAATASSICWWDKPVVFIDHVRLDERRSTYRCCQKEAHPLSGRTSPTWTSWFLKQDLRRLVSLV